VLDHGGVNRIPPPSLRRPLTGAAALALVAGLAAGCTSSGTEEPGPGTDPTVSISPSASAGASGSASSSSSATSTPTPTPSLAGFSLDDRHSPGWPQLAADLGIGREARVGMHPGYVRVVYEFTGSAAPDYRVHYVDQPVEDGSGDVRDVPGDVWLEVLVTSLGMPGESAPTPEDPLPSSLKGTGIAAAPALWGGFEGVGQQFIGLIGDRRPFKVTTMTDPSRLVVDIAR
jgi:hypothetical protein